MKPKPNMHFTFMYSYSSSVGHTWTYGVEIVDIDRRFKFHKKLNNEEWEESIREYSMQEIIVNTGSEFRRQFLKAYGEFIGVDKILLGHDDSD